MNRSIIATPATLITIGAGCADIGGEPADSLDEILTRNPNDAGALADLAAFNAAQGLLQGCTVLGHDPLRLLINNVAQADHIIAPSASYVHGWWWDAGNVRTCKTDPYPLPPFFITKCTTSPRRLPMRGEVIWASGDTFHYGGRFHNN